MRVYVGTTLGELDSLRRTGLSVPIAAHAVTGALREWYAEGDADELEYAAAAHAAVSSLRRLAAGAPMRRVVVAAELPDTVVQPDADAGPPSSVLVSEPIALGHVVSVHVDDISAEADVAAAVQALPAADDGDEDAQLAVDTVDDHELLWYDVTELDDVLRP